MKFRIDDSRKSSKVAEAASDTAFMLMGRGLRHALRSAKVELSSTAAGLMKSAAPAEFDAAKVDRISKSIADGSYKVNAEAIADKLIANAQEVLGNVKR